MGAIVFVLTLLFNARQEAHGPANSGWIPSWPSMKVAGVTPGGPMDKAGLRTGDVLEAAGGQPLTGMPDWFVARAHFERNRPIDLQIQREGQHLRLQLVITDPSFHTWNTAQHDSVLAFYLARLILLSLAILIAFSRSQQQLPVTRRKPGTLRLRVGRFAQAQLIGSLQLASTSGSWPRSLAETSM